MALDQVQVNRLWEAVLHSGHDVVWAVDPDGILTFLTGACEDMLGRSPDDLIGHSVFSMIHAEDVDRARAILADCAARQVGWQQVQLRVVRADGTARWVETSGIAHVDGDGNLVSFTATTSRLDADSARTADLGLIRDRIDRVMAGRLLRTIWQPIYSLDDGRIAGVEALTRFLHPQIERPPDRWFADAHEVGAGVDLELLAIETALAAAGTLPHSPYVSLNVSPGTLASGRLAAVLDAGGLPYARIVLELTEHVSIEDYDVVVASLDRLRERGVRLAIDDAGAGFASFRHILRLRPDIIKLDQSITCGISKDPAQRALAAALVMFAMDVGSLAVIAEGVENESDLSIVSTLGLDAAQGYHLARPVPAERIAWDSVIRHAWLR